MTDRVETDGWLVFTNGTDTVKLYCENVKWEQIYKGKIKHYDTGFNIGIPVFKIYISLMAERCWLDSTVKIDAYISYMKAWLAAGTLTVKFTYDGTNFQKLDGTNTIFPCMVKKGLGFIQKEAHGDQEIYTIDKIMVQQTGAAS